jgi:hypothetical protein
LPIVGQKSKHRHIKPRLNKQRQKMINADEQGALRPMTVVRSFGRTGFWRACVFMLATVACGCSDDTAPSTPDAAVADDAAADAAPFDAKPDAQDGALSDGGQPDGSVRVIDTHDYWPLDVGRSWVFERESDPNQLTTIQIVPTAGGGIAARFTKNATETYWSPNANMDLRWHLTAGDDYLYAGNGQDSDLRGVLNDFPDDERFDRDTGQWISSLWYRQGDDTDLPAYTIFPWQLEVPSEVNYAQAYVEQYRRPGQAVASSLWMCAWWQVRYSEQSLTVTTDGGVTTYDGPVLRVRFEESFDNTGIDGWIQEDWYFAPNLGPVRIDQYLKDPDDPGDATYLSVRIKLRETDQELTMAVGPERVQRPAVGEMEVTYTFEVFGGTPQQDPGVRVVYDPSGPVSDGWLDPLSSEDSWQANTYTFPGSISADTPLGTWGYQIADLSGNLATAKMTVHATALTLEVTPDTVTRPSSGETDVTYHFAVSGGEPDTTIGVEGIYGPDGVYDPVRLADLHGGSWQANTYVFPWQVAADTPPGTYVYRVTDLQGNEAVAAVVIE